MEKSCFIHLLKPLFYCTPPETISGNTCYKQLKEWNIILAVTLSEEIEATYRVQLHADDFSRAETLDELCALVLSRRDF